MPTMTSQRARAQRRRRRVLGEHGAARPPPGCSSGRCASTCRDSRHEYRAPGDRAPGFRRRGRAHPGRCRRPRCDPDRAGLQTGDDRRASSSELEFSSPENAAAIIGRALSRCRQQTIGRRRVRQMSPVPARARAACSTASRRSRQPRAAASTRWPATWPTSPARLSDAGVDAEAMVIVTNPRQATKLRLLAGPAFTISGSRHHRGRGGNGRRHRAGRRRQRVRRRAEARGLDGEHRSFRHRAGCKSARLARPTPSPRRRARIWQTDTTALKVRTKCGVERSASGRRGPGDRRDVVMPC